MTRYPLLYVSNNRRLVDVVKDYNRKDQSSHTPTRFLTNLFLHTFVTFHLENERVIASC